MDDLSTVVSQYELQIRLGFFFGVFLIMATWEVLAPRRPLTVSKAVRWANNLGLVFLNSVILRLLFPTAAVGVAIMASEKQWGWLNQVDLTGVGELIIAIVILDMAIYIQHVMVHAIPMFWRLHRVHHADMDYDVTTGARFHPVEIILSILIKFAIIILIGVPVLSVVIFEVILNAMAMFNHGNVGLPPLIDKVLRWFVVTPDMHRVHHSVEDDETNSNFGFNLSIWDRVFGTYRSEPRAGQLGMIIGINKFREMKESAWIWGLLMMPFKGKISEYAINTRRWGPDSPE